jgi:broad specificity phosphatase PhoE
MTAPATRLLLVRHGEVAAFDRFYGHHDVGLSPAGVAQAEAVARALAGVTVHAVYSSDLARARAGAQLIADARGLIVQASAAFREMSLGVLEGRRRDEPHPHHPETLGKQYADMVDYAFPGGESFRDVAARLRPAVTALLAAHAAQTVALVAHNSVNRIVLGDALGIALEGVFCFQQSFGCINVLDYPGGAGAGGPARLRLLNWIPGGPIPATSLPPVAAAPPAGETP